MLIIKLSAIFIFLGLFIIYIGFPKIQIKSRSVIEKLNKIKNYGKVDFKKLKKGISLFEPIRLMLGNKFDFEYMFEKKKRKIINLGLDEKINVTDIVIGKTLSLITLIILGIIYVVLDIKTYENINLFLIDNVINIVIYFTIIIAILIGDDLILDSMRDSRNKQILKRLVFFINLFKTNIMSGDNLYLALDNCGKEIKGTLGVEIKKTVKEFHTKGQINALQNFADRIGLEELTDFMSIIITGLENKNEDFAEFLDENEISIQEIKESKAIEKQTSKPIQAVLLNTLGFISAMSIIITVFMLNLLKMIDTM